MGSLRIPAAVAALVSVLTVGPARAEMLSCATAGYVTALAESVQRSARGHSGEDARLLRMARARPVGPILAEFRATLAPSQFAPAKRFLIEVRRLSSRDRIVPDRQLELLAARSLSTLGAVECGRPVAERSATGGAGSEGGGADGRDGEVYVARDRTAWLDPETVRRLTIGTSILLAIAAGISAFRQASVLNRRHRRHTCGMDCILALSRGRRMTVRLVDLSEGGCKIVSRDAPALPGSEVALHVGELRLAATVQWAAGGACGLRFDTAVGPDRVDAILQVAREARRARRLARRRAVVGAR